MLLDDAALRQLLQDLCQSNGAELAWAWLRQLLPRLRLLRSIVKRGGNCGSRPEFRRAVWDRLPESRSLSSRAGQLVLPQSGQWPRCLRFSNCWGPTPLHHTPGHAFHQLHWWSENFTAACLIAAHCILIRAISCSSVFGGARVFVWRMCKAARMLQESTCQRHASCPPSVLCFAARCECHLRAHQPHVPTYRARTSARVRSTRPSLPMQRASQLTQSPPFALPPASVHR